MKTFPDGGEMSISLEGHVYLITTDSDGNETDKHQLEDHLVLQLLRNDIEQAIRLGLAKYEEEEEAQTEETE